MVVQFYIQLKADLAEHKPGIKVLSIKLVIFFSFWQTMVISFLASANGPLQPTAKLGYQDIKIGIPSVILIIEMSLFSVLHIFAYPWKPYSVRQNPLDDGYNTPATKHYQGGPMGIKALADAFNPWDIVKASARGFRWMFVGVRQRHMDVSYQPAAAKLGPEDTGYMGPTYAMAGDASADPMPSSKGRRGRAATAEDDRAGLLHDAQIPAHTGPYRPVTNDEFEAGDDGHIDLGVPRHPASSHVGSSPWAADWKPSEFEDREEDFHPGMGPPPGVDLAVGRSGDVHPVHRGHSPNVPPGQGWNHWGGVEGSSPPHQQGRGGYDH